jgi:hypothetical protein
MLSIARSHRYGRGAQLAAFPDRAIEATYRPDAVASIADYRNAVFAIPKGFCGPKQS